MNPWVVRLHHAALTAELSGFKYLGKAFREMISTVIDPVKAISPGYPSDVAEGDLGR